MRTAGKEPRSKRACKWLLLLAAAVGKPNLLPGKSSQGAWPRGPHAGECCSHCSDVA